MRASSSITTLLVVLTVLSVAGSTAADQRVFVSSQATFGDLGGLDGADALCRDLAAAANLGGDWIAWLSDSSTHARDRLTGDGPFTRVDGTVIANDRADLLDGSLDVPIGFDEYGNNPVQGVVVTGTKGDGTRYVGSATLCADWTSSQSALTPVGFATVTSSGWSYSGSGDCSHPLLVYCFEVPVVPLLADGFESGTTDQWSSTTP